ncbi:trimethyllysine dioxygenase [Batrachochytrium dendrobatidis JEL423]|uniref:Trimethyllysine dioxygenase n=1 Tax=Batrachochytrium dendrobatidis (strain JEL423) TaxID=403673 RepID=A0A177WE21_BATDL|nr:trimethyllysine dioxygenase [Batrachochytrium dendrobatidis JEL423]
MSPFSSLLTIRSKSDLTHSSVSPTASISDTDSTTRITFADGSSTSLTRSNWHNSRSRWTSNHRHKPSHTTEFTLDWLQQHSYAPKVSIKIDKPSTNKQCIHESNYSGVSRKFWDASIVSNLPTTPYKDIMGGNDGLQHWLTNIDTYGFGFVSGVPVDPKATEELGRRISFIRETHYGSFWDFTPNMEHGDTAYTTLGLGAHTDTTYFTDPIGLQLFHLLEHTGTGGESLYVDAFHVANLLKQESPWAFDALTQIQITAHSAGDEHTFMQPTPKQFPLIKLDNFGNVLQVRYNNNDRSVLDSLSKTDVEQFYAALRVWMTMVKDRRNEAWVKLVPGMAVMVDNWRVLHGRSAFTGFRRLVGSYHGWDDYRSKVMMICGQGKAKDDL